MVVKNHHKQLMVHRFIVDFLFYFMYQLCE